MPRFSKIFSQTLISTLVLAVAGTCGSAQAQSRNADTAELMREKRREREELQARRSNACASLTNQMAAAASAKDWLALDRIANRYLMECEGRDVVELDHAMANAHSSVAMAQRKLGNMGKAISAANACRARDFSNAMCHWELGLALDEVGRKSDARVAYAATLSIAKSTLESNRRQLEQSSMHLREMLEADNRLMEVLVERTQELLEVTD